MGIHNNWNLRISNYKRQVFDIAVRYQLQQKSGTLEPNPEGPSVYSQTRELMRGMVTQSPPGLPQAPRYSYQSGREEVSLRQRMLRSCQVSQAVPSSTLSERNVSGSFVYSWVPENDERIVRNEQNKAKQGFRHPPHNQSRGYQGYNKNCKYIPIVLRLSLKLIKILNKWYS